jgi:hypothetical protein
MRVKGVHTFPLRMKNDDFSESRVLSFKHEISLNELYRDMIKYCQSNPTYLKKIKDEKDERDKKTKSKHAGHFVYISKYQ